MAVLVLAADQDASFVPVGKVLHVSVYVMYRQTAPASVWRASAGAV